MRKCSIWSIWQELRVKRKQKKLALNAKYFFVTRYPHAVEALLHDLISFDSSLESKTWKRLGSVSDLHIQLATNQEQTNRQQHMSTLEGRFIIPTENAHGKYPREIPTENTYGKYPRKIPTENTHGKYPRKIPTENTHGKYLRKIPTGPSGPM